MPNKKKKKCTRCKRLLSITSFHHNRSKKDGLHAECKLCVKEYRKTPQSIEYQKEYEKTPHRKEYKKTLQYKESAKRYHKDKMLNDPIYKIRIRLRTRMYRALLREFKSGSAVRDLGCSMKQLKTHLQRKFKKGMDWSNYGKWHIDHIKPLISFDLTNKWQFLIAVNYKNLQPLWAFDNCSKGSKKTYEKASKKRKPLKHNKLKYNKDGRITSTLPKDIARDID